MADVIVGVDWGASFIKVLAVSAESGEKLTDREFEGGGPSALADAELVERLETALSAACAGDRIVAACVGLAGAAAAAEAGRTIPLGRVKNLPANTVIVSDLHLAWHTAFGRDCGTLMVAGTGSSVLGRTRDGKEVRIDGWGTLCGDRFGAAWLALRALREGFRELDGTGDSQFVLGLARALGFRTVAEMVSGIEQRNWKRQVAAGAPLIVQLAEKGNLLAVKAVEETIEAACECASFVGRRLPGAVRRIALTGGLVENSFFRKGLIERLRQACAEADVFKLERRPAEGAILLAAETLGVKPEWTRTWESS